MSEILVQTLLKARMPTEQNTRRQPTIVPILGFIPVYASPHSSASTTHAPLSGAS